MVLQQAPQRAIVWGYGESSKLITLTIDNQVYYRVIQYLASASSGTVVAGGNVEGFNNTQMNYPIGLYFDSSSNSLTG
jgi:hypothetical protein